MNIGKFDGMYKLLFDYKHEINQNIPDKLKCAKCKYVLINACQVPCGCRYCCDCVDKMLKDGVVHCPGNTDDCKEEYLLNNQLDFRANKAISKLIVKCPEETCLHECELIQMEEHFRICGKLSKKCPFAEFGCCNRQMAIEILNEHCQSSNFNHCKILIEMIDNIKNENDSLKIKQINNEIKIEKLENELKAMSEEMQLVKLENENFKQQIELLKENIDKRFEEFSKEMKNENFQINQSIDKETIEMKIEKNEMKQDLEKMKNVENKLEEMIIEMKKENQEIIKSINDETKSINNKSEMMETRINKMNKIIDKFGYAIIELTIDKLNERKINNEHILSEYFTSKSNTYNLRLSFNIKNDSYRERSRFSVELFIYSGRNDSYLSWPFKGDITISIVNTVDSNINKTITKYCEISKPSSDSYRSSNSQNSNVNAQFEFLYDSLTELKVIQNNCLTISCFVNFK